MAYEWVVTVTVLNGRYYEKRDVRVKAGTAGLAAKRAFERVWREGLIKPRQRVEDIAFSCKRLALVPAAELADQG